MDSAQAGGETIYLVDDDVAVLRALTRTLQASGYDVRPFDSPFAFLDEHDAQRPGCAIFEVALPVLGGLALQEALASSGGARQIIFLTGDGDIPTSVKAMRAGAVDFLTKPVDVAKLLGAIRAALEEDRRAREALELGRSIRRRLAALTPRERQVLERVVAGRLNKEIAAELGTVEKTIKVHRAHVMQKMSVRTLAELVRAWANFTRQESEDLMRIPGLEES